MFQLTYIYIYIKVCNYRIGTAGGLQWLNLTGPSWVFEHLDIWCSWMGHGWEAGYDDLHEDNWYYWRPMVNEEWYY